MRHVIEVRRRGARRCLPPIVAASVLLLCAIATARGQGPEVKVIEIEIGDNMRYAPPVIDAEPGQKLRVVLKPVGKIKALGHNFVLLKQGTEAKPFVDKAVGRTAKAPRSYRFTKEASDWAGRRFGCRRPDFKLGVRTCRRLRTALLGYLAGSGVLGWAH